MLLRITKDFQKMISRMVEKTKLRFAQKCIVYLAAPGINNTYHMLPECFVRLLEAGTI